MSKILGMGNALVDIIYKIDSDEDLLRLNLPKGSMNLVDAAQAEIVLAYFKDKQRTVATGGSASNTISGIASMGMETGFIGSVGNDDYGQFYEDALQAQHTKVFMQRKEMASGTAITLMSPDSERTFATYLGAACTLGKDFLKEEYFQGYDYFHVEGYLVQNHELIETAMQMAKKAGVKVSIDMASYNIVEADLEFFQHIVRNYVDIVFANEEEAKAFTGKDSLEALNAIGDMCEVAVVKIGARGSLLKHQGRVYHINPCSAECIDTNGAGDSYAAGILYALGSGLDMQKAGNIASLISSKVVEVVGAKLDAESWKELNAKIRNMI